MPVAPSTLRAARCSRGSSAPRSRPRASCPTRQRELQRDPIADPAQVVRRDEHAAGADVLGEAGVEVVIALEIDLHLEIESLRGPNILLVLCHFGPRPVFMDESLLLFRVCARSTSASQPRRFDRSDGETVASLRRSRTPPDAKPAGSPSTSRLGLGGRGLSWRSALAGLLGSLGSRPWPWPPFAAFVACRPSRPSRLRLRRPWRRLAGRLRSAAAVLGHQLEQRHRRRVARALGQLHDAGVAAGAADEAGRRARRTASAPRRGRAPPGAPCAPREPRAPTPRSCAGPASCVSTSPTRRAQVMVRSASRRVSLALASVVRMRSLVNSAATRLENSALRCADVRER